MAIALFAHRAHAIEVLLHFHAAHVRHGNIQHKATRRGGHEARQKVARPREKSRLISDGTQQRIQRPSHAIVVVNHINGGYGNFFLGFSITTPIDFLRAAIRTKIGGDCRT